MSNRVPVTFRTAHDDNGVTAVFLSRETHPTNDAQHRMCYAHVGQHGECALAWVRESTRAATPEEYAPLLRELESIYNDADSALSVQSFE